MRLHSCVSLAMAALLFVLAGCSSNSVSESRCIAGDWQTIGYRDGADGYRSTQLLNHQNACVKHGVIPIARRTWPVGRRCARDCEPNDGYEVGERGEGYDNVCPDDMRDAFLAPYHAGRDLLSRACEVRDLEDAISQREYRLDEIKTELVSSTTQQLIPR